MEASGSGTHTLTVTVPISHFGEHTAFDIGWCYAVYSESEETGYIDMVMPTDAGNGGDDGADGEDEEEEKGFIPGFEAVMLIGAIGISAVLLSRKLR